MTWTSQNMGGAKKQRRDPYNPGTQNQENWKFKSKVLMKEEHSAKAKRHPETFAGSRDSWDGLPPMHLTLYLPPRPTCLQELAIAITAYSDTGRTYPMTSG